MLKVVILVMIIKSFCLLEKKNLHPFQRTKDLHEFRITVQGILTTKCAKKYARFMRLLIEVG